MTNFFYKNKNKLIFVVFLAFLLFTLTGCRMNAQEWYTKPYTTYGAEWVQMWDGGSGFWNSIWGWPITLISYPVAWLCSTIGKALGNSFFWGIFFTTIIVRTLAWPIYGKQNGMSLKMQLMQPEMDRLQRKYANKKDPQSQQKMQMEMAQIYKKYKVNPLGCFGTMFLQFPIFMGMYEVVQRVNATTTELVDGSTALIYSGKFALANTKVFGFFEMNTSFFEATEIKDKIFGLVIALAFGGIQIIQQKLSQRPPKYQKQHKTVKRKEQEQQQKQMQTMMIVMQVMFVFMALSNTTLAIYWFIGAIYQIFQSQVGRFINEKNYYKMKDKKIL